MARYEFKLPDIGEGIAEAEIVAWHIKVGDQVSEDQQLADMMTDKATVEMESPVAGTVVALAGAVGDQIPIGSVLVVFETEAGAGASEPAAPAACAAASTSQQDGTETDAAGDGRFHLQRGLVSHHVGKLLVFFDHVADLHMPGDDLGLGDPFADIRQLEFVARHGWFSPPKSS